MRVCVSWCVVLVLSTAVVGSVYGANWPRFRGPGGAARSDEKNLPTTWSQTQNLRWKLELPGRGSSSPIVFGNRVFVTCYSGYGIDRNNPGNMRDLKRHLLCIDRAGGTCIFDAAPKFKQIAVNRFASDKSDFHGTPAFSNGQIFLRSNRFLYCVQAAATSDRADRTGGVAALIHR